MQDLHNNRNLILVLTFFLISAAALIGTGELEAIAFTSEYIFNEYTIRVKNDNIDIGGPVQHGILPLVSVDSTGNLALLPDITEISVTDRDGMLISCEEARPILEQALTHRIPLSPVLLVSNFRRVETESGHHFEILQGSFVDDFNAPMIATSPALRSQLFKEAVIRAVAMEETRYFAENVLDNTSATIDPEGFLKLLEKTSKALDVAEIVLDQHLEHVIHLRTMSGTAAQLSQSLPAEFHGLVSQQTWASIHKRVSKRVHNSRLGKFKVSSKANTILSVMNTALSVVGNTLDAQKKIAALAQLNSQLEIMQGLNSALVLMKVTNADPAMITGTEAAIDELVTLSANNWAKALKEGILESAPSLAGLVGSALGGPLGKLLAEEFVAWVQLLDGWKQDVLRISALATLGNYLHRDEVLLGDSRIDDLVSGRLADEVGMGFPARELISFHETISAETSAWIYNRLWEKRWDDESLVGQVEGLGKAVSEWFTKLRTGVDLEKEWKEWVTQRVTVVHHTKTLLVEMSTYLDELEDVCIPKPVSESTSLADIALIIDSSGSMGDPSNPSDPNNLRISGAKLFIDSADPKVQIAIIDFDSSARTFAPLTFADFAGKTSLGSAVDRVDANGGTNIDAGLQQGFQELNASTSSAKKAAVLLTDGEDSSSTRQVVSDYAARGWLVYTIGLGSGVNRQKLEDIATATGGEYFYAAHDSDIQSVYPKILAKMTNKSVVASYKGYINENQVITKDVTVDENIDQMDTSMTWDGSSIELVLIDPDGTQITPQNFNATPGITYKDEPTYAIYTLERPKPGIWQLQATGTDIPTGGEQFNLIVTATSDFATNFLAFDSSYAVGDPIRVGINIKEKIGDTFAAVLGATTTAEIVRPDGKIATLALFDDGSHNDRVANDGVYANTYSSVDKEGTYLITISAQNGFSREIREQVVVGRIDNVLIDTSTLTPAAGATLKQAPSVISAVISGPAGRVDSNSIVLKVDGSTVSHRYDAVNQLVSYRPGGLSAGSHNVQLSVRDTSGNALETTWSFSTQVADALTERTTLTGHTSDVLSVVFSPDGQTLASGSFDNTIRLWDVATGTELKKLIGHTDWVWGVGFSPDGQTLVSASVDKTVRLWDIATGTHETLARHRDAVSSVSFSPDGQTLAGGSLDNTIHLWDVTTGIHRKMPIGHTGLVWDVSFSPDGRTLASGSADSTIHLWDVTTGIQHQIFTGHTQSVYSVSFSPDGQTLASGSADRIIRLWDVTTGTQRQTLTGHTDTVLSVSFSPDGQTLASGSADNTIRLWGSAPDVQPPALAADVNGDGVVDTHDMTLVYANLGEYGQNDADVNGDGIVNAEDIVLVLAAIAAAGGAPARHTQVSHLFTAEEVQQWLTEARQFADKSPAHRRGVLLLEQILTLLTPEETVLLPNYPNPFNPETWIPYRLANPAEVTLTIYAVNGQVLQTLDLGHQAAGFYEGRSRAAYWDGRNALGERVASGVYFYTLTAGDFTATRRMLIRK